MTTTRLTRRTALAGAAVLPILPAAAMARDKVRDADLFAEPTNATDAAWARYLAAKADYEAASAAYDAKTIDGEAIDRAGERYCDADGALQEAPTRTLVDAERKLQAAHDFEAVIEHEDVGELLDAVRRLNRGGVA